MDPEENAGNADGDGGDAGNDPGGQGQGGSVEPGVAGQAQALPYDALPEQLRGRSPAEVKLILGQMVSAIQMSASEQTRLRQELEEARRGPSASKEPDKPKRSYEESILEDPESTITEIVEKRFGKRFAEVESGAARGIYSDMRSADPEFAEHENDVREYLRQAKIPVTENSVRSTYLMVVGDKALRGKRDAEAKKVAGAEKSRGGGGDKAKKVELTELEREVAKGMKMDEEKYAKAKKSWTDKSFEIKVPTGVAKKAGDK